MAQTLKQRNRKDGNAKGVAVRKTKDGEPQSNIITQYQNLKKSNSSNGSLTVKDKSLNSITVPAGRSKTLQQSSVKKKRTK